jgi:hypothetical protein
MTQKANLRGGVMRSTNSFVERLEDRRMLSATLVDPATLSADANSGLALAPISAPLKAVKRKPKPVVTTTPSLVNNYFGKLKSSGVIFGIGSRQLDFELLITGQTSTTLTGHFEVDGYGADATLKGFEKTNGKFSYSVNTHGFTFKITGKESNNGLTLGGHGSIKLNSVSIFKTSGGFVVNASS